MRKETDADKANTQRMNSFLHEASTLRWWLDAFVVGILVHVVATHVTRRVDAGGGKVSMWWRTRTAAQRERRRHRIERLLANPHEEILVGQNAIYSIVRSAVTYLSAVLIVVWNNLGAGNHDIESPSKLLIEILVAALAATALHAQLYAEAQQSLVMETRIERGKREIEDLVRQTERARVETDELIKRGLDAPRNPPA